MGVSNGAGTGIAKYGLNQVFASSGSYIFSTPPADSGVVTGLGRTLIDWTLNYDLNQAEALIKGSNATFTESAMSFITPPNPTDLKTPRNRSAKLMVYHGSADPVFTAGAWIGWTA